MKLTYKNGSFKIFNGIIFIFLLLFFNDCKSSDPWTEYKSAEGKFTAEFPKKPESQKQVINSEVGELTMNIVMYDASKDDEANLVYMINYTDYPDTLINSDKKETLESFFRNSTDGAVKNVHGKLLSEKIISVGDYPGREIRIDFQNGKAVITSRVYLVKNRMIMLEVITGTKNDFNKRINQFLRI